MQIIYTWDNVEEIQETEESVDIYTQKGGCVVVRKRAFTRPGEQQQFIELANRYVEGDKDSSYRIVFDDDEQAFGLECTLDSGVEW